MYRALSSLGLAILLCAACDSGEPVPGPPAAPAPPTPAAADTKADADADADASGGQDDAGAPAETPKVADVPNAAFLFARDKALVALTDEGFATVPGTEGIYITRMLHGADGKLYAQSTSSIAHVQTGGLTPVAPTDFGTVGTINGFDVAKDGTIWAIGSNGVSHYRDGSWTSQTTAELGLGEDRTVGIAVDSAGEPWAATSDAIAHRVGDKWEPAKLPAGRTQYLDHVGRGTDGEIYIATFDRLFRLTGTPGRVKVKVGSYDSPGEFAFSQSTLGVAKAGLEDVSIFLPADKAKRYKGRSDLGKIGTLTAVTADDQGRVWASGEGGMAIVGPGDERTVWRSGSIDEIAGRVGPLAVRGTGPKLPEAGEVKKGGIRGRLMKEGAGVAGVKIELCESPSMVFSRTPCTGAPTHLKGKTDAEGNFVFEDVPLGAYGFAVKSGRGKWKITLGAAMGMKMVEGEIYDMGSLDWE